MSNSKTTRQLVPASEVLQSWAEVAHGGKMKAWTLSKSSGADEPCDFHQSCYLHVEEFFRLAKLGQYRELQKRLMLEGRDPTPRELPDAMYFAMRFRRWYRRNSITIVKRLEEA